ncbi:hypothetical protein GXW83_31800 [Streptacidiphilus sp. PB12-B1b]|uniref:hypothetical protein n=1 Tax=Streptacidiphilus sp. PB12-B1b TaxID=2705012 RepID=UPI0015F94375|nr:hypothetical protein [Streptacidiphilus sp. PB12-B1b]QMU79612.1 hypothetical protein GXW83_31800 [Streptacidiphilus sp. PB12-B1b]
MIWLYIALGVFAGLVALAALALQSMRAEFEEIAADERARSEFWSRRGKQVIAAEKRRRQADVLRWYADLGSPVRGPDGVTLTAEQLRFAAQLIDQDGTP